jgi:hypothetical protein
MRCETDRGVSPPEEALAYPYTRAEWIAAEIIGSGGKADANALDSQQSRALHPARCRYHRAPGGTDRQHFGCRHHGRRSARCRKLARV